MTVGSKHVSSIWCNNMESGACVCVYRLNRRKTSGTICTLRLYIILYYITFYGRGSPGSRGVGDQDTPRGPV